MTTMKERKKLSKMKPLPWLPLKAEDGEYLEYAGNGYWGVFGLSKEKSGDIRKHLKLNGATGSFIKKNEALPGTYTVYFRWDFIRK